MKSFLTFGVGIVAGLALFGAGAGARIVLPMKNMFTFEDEAQLQQIPPSTPAPLSIRIPILIYHTVHPTRPGETKMQQEFNVPPDIFEAELGYLKSRGFTVISMRELVRDVTEGTTSAAKPVVLTFDDGSHGQYEYAFPLLQKYGGTATFYIYTNPLDTHNKYFLSWDEVRQMQAAGMTIGSHTITHPYLSRISASQLHHEIFDSKAIIEREIGVPVTHFASPFGFTNPDIVRMLHDAGYVTGRTTFSGNYQSKDKLLRLTGYFAPADLSKFAWIVEKAL